MHDWEQLDQGKAYCLNCGTDKPNTECKKDAPKPQERVTLPREVKTEIENLRRLVQTVQDRLHALTRT